MIPEPLTVSASQSCDKHRAEREAERFNESIGKLDKKVEDCPICKNKGWIMTTMKADGYDEPLTTVVECGCMKRRKAHERAEASGLGDLKRFTVDDFKAIEEWQKDIKVLVVDYIQNGGEHWLALLGSSGAGKTHLCVAVANEFLIKNVGVRYEVWPTMTKDLKKDVFSQNGTKEMLNDLMNIPVLYIDDLFKGVVSEQDISLMFDLLNHRYNTNKITIITSERLVEDIAKIDVAIAGRIKERCGKYLRQIVGSEKNYRFKV